MHRNQPIQSTQIVAAQALPVHESLDSGSNIFLFDFQSFSTWVGIVLGIFAAVWIRLARLGIIAPANTAYALGSITLIISMEILYGIDPLWLIVQFAAAGWLIWLGSVAQRSVLVAFGAITGFAAIISLLLEAFDEPGSAVAWIAATIGLGVLAVAASSVTGDWGRAAASPPPATEE